MVTMMAMVATTATTKAAPPPAEELPVPTDKPTDVPVTKATLKLTSSSVVAPGVTSTQPCERLLMMVGSASHFTSRSTPLLIHVLVL